MKNSQYDLNFYQALQRVLENNIAIRGDNFAPGCFLTLNSKNELVIKDANNFYASHPFVLYKGIEAQKFREVRIFTQRNLSE